MNKIFFVKNYADVKEYHCVIIRRGGSGYIAQKYEGDFVEDIMEFDTTDLEEREFFKESIAKLRKIVGEDIHIYCERFQWQEVLTPKKAKETLEELEELNKSFFDSPKIEDILDEMAERRGEL